MKESFGNNEWSQEEVDKRNEKVRDEVEKMKEKMMKDGYNFSITENPNDYELHIEGVTDVYHITKVSQLYRKGEHGYENWTIAEALENRIKQMTNQSKIKGD